MIDISLFIIIINKTLECKPLFDSWQARTARVWSDNKLVWQISQINVT